MSQTNDSFDGRALTDEDIEKVEEFAYHKKASVLVIFFDDMKGSTVLKEKITEQFNEEAFQRLRREHDDLLTSIISRENAGEIIKSTGDGLLAVFSEPSTAVERSIEIQQNLLGHPYINVRIGMDMGQVRVESAGGVKKDMFGRHVDWAARATALAGAGHICVTKSVYIDAFGWISKDLISWKEHGTYCLKRGEPALDIYEPYNSNTTQPMDKLRGSKVTPSLSQRWQIQPRLRYIFIISAFIITIVFALSISFRNEKRNIDRYIKGSESNVISEVIISGEVRDKEDNKPVKDKRIAITIDGYDFEAVSKDDGKFMATLHGVTSEVITLRATHREYNSYCIDRKISSKNENFIIILTRRSE